MSLLQRAGGHAILLVLLLAGCRPLRGGSTPEPETKVGPRIDGMIRMSGRSTQALAEAERTTPASDAARDASAKESRRAGPARSKAKDLTADFDVPDGFAVTLFAESPQLFNPSAIDVDERGRVWVTEAVNYRQWQGRNPGLHHDAGDRVVILEDTDGDGVADRSKVFVQDPDLVSPLGIAVVADAKDPRKKRVFVSCSPTIWEYVDSDGDDVPDEKKVFLTGFGGPNHDHGVHSLVVGPDGRFYIAVGNAGPHIVTDKAGWTLRSGSIYRGGGEHEADNHPRLVSDDGKMWVGGLILRCEPDGTGLTVMAHNFRNQYEVALDSFGNLFTADNDDDGNACCRTTWVMEGGNYGYFSADGSRTWEADRRPGQDVWRAHWHQDDPGVMPAGTRNGAGGPTGVCVYEGELFGKDWIGRVLNADAGANCVYAHVPVAKGAGIDLQPGILITSRPKSGEKKDRWFRPSDVCASTDGSILVSDWWDPGVGGHLAGDPGAYGRILRIVPKGVNPQPPKIDMSTVEGAVGALASPAIHVRSLGFRALRADGEHALRNIEQVLQESSARGQPRAVWLLAQPDQRFHETLVRVLTQADSDLAVAAFRVLRMTLGVQAAERSKSEASQGAPPTHPDVLDKNDLKDDLLDLHVGYLAKRISPAVRRETALALLELSESRQSQLEEDWWIQIAGELATRLETGDRWNLEAVGLALEARANQCYSRMEDDSGDPLQWTDRFAALAWRLHPRVALPAFTIRARSTSLAEGEQRRAVEALGLISERMAGEAMLDLALGGPEDTRALATWWVRHNDETIWREYKLAAQLPDDDRDGAKLVWSSGILTKGSVEVDVDITGANSLWLVVTSGKLGNGCDWADWIEPRLDGVPGELALTGVPWRSASAEWGNVNVGRNANGGPLAIDGAIFQDGLGTHAASEIAFDVPKGYQRFQARAGLDDGGTSQGGRPDVEFQVWTKSEVDPAEIAERARRLADPDATDDALAPLVASLAGTREGALLLLRLAGEKKLSPRASAFAAARLPSNPDLSIRALAMQFFAFPTPSGSGPNLPDPAEVLALAGSASRGSRVFSGDTAQCSTCHAFHGRGGDVGPDLTAISVKYGKPEILDAILHPSKSIAHGFDAWLIETKDGLLESGFLLADGDPVVLKDTAGKRHVIPADEIESRTKQSVSTMPDGVALGLSKQDLADLLEFLRSDPKAPGKRLAPRALFDGKSLSEWTFFLETPEALMEDVWKVKDGVLRCAGNPIGYLRTKEDFTSFELVVEWRFDPALPPGNSGVLLRMTGEDKVWPDSIEAQLHSRNAGDIWNIGGFPMEADPSRTEGRRTRKALPCNEKPIGEWNRYVITLDGGELTLEVNGEVQNRASGCEERSGKICLQSEGAAIEFRTIEITPIER